MFNKGIGYYAAAFSYYAPLALVPLLFISLISGGVIYGKAYTTQVFGVIQSILGTDLAVVIKEAVLNLSQSSDGLLPAISSIVISIIFYVVAINVLGDGFAKIWGTAGSGFKYKLKRLFRAILSLFLVQTYLLLFIGLEFFIIPFFFGQSLMMSYFFLFILTTCFFTGLYRVLVPRSMSLRSAFVGAATSSVLFVLSKELVNFYLDTKPAISLYGTAGLILVLLLWLYVLAIVIFYGAAVAGVHRRLFLSKNKK
jgi:membrane protein